MSIYQDVRISVAVLPKGRGSGRVPIGAGRAAYVHMARGSAFASGQLLKAGDAMAVTEAAEVTFTDAEDAEVLIFDLPWV